MSAMRVLILTAVFPEARALARAFHLAEVRAAVPMWRRDELGVALVGIRARRAAQLEAAAEAAGVDLVIMAGVAGALSPALQVGDVVVESRGSYVALPPLGKAFLGRVLTQQQIVARPAEKARLFQQTGCLAVDIEGDVAAEFAARNAAAFVSIRGISDTADETLDPALLTLVDDAGYPQVGRAVGLLFRRPTALPGMLRLQRATTKAMGSVTQTLQLLLASGWPGRAPERHGET